MQVEKKRLRFEKSAEKYLIFVAVCHMSVDEIAHSTEINLNMSNIAFIMKAQNSQFSFKEKKIRASSKIQKSNQYFYSSSGFRRLIPTLPHS